MWCIMRAWWCMKQCVYFFVCLLCWPGPRHLRPRDEVEPQWPVDADSGPCRIHQVLAIQHEQRENVSGAQGPNTGAQVRQRHHCCTVDMVRGGDWCPNLHTSNTRLVSHLWWISHYHIPLQCFNRCQHVPWISHRLGSLLVCFGSICVHCWCWDKIVWTEASTLVH